MKLIRTIFVAAALSFMMPNVSLAGTQTFYSNGTFTVPAGVTSVTVSMSGGGGGGGGASAVAENGGPTYFGSFLTALGGLKSNQQGLRVAPYVTSGGAAGGIGGSAGGNGGTTLPSGSGGQGGAGGNSLFGVGGDGDASNGVSWIRSASGGSGYGSGGGGGGWYAGGGGGAQAFNSVPVAVVSEQTIPVTVGTGGVGGVELPPISVLSGGSGAPGFVSVSYSCSPGYVESGLNCILSTGTVNVSSSIPSSWTITGPATITGSGFSQSSPSQPVGTYTITWNPVSGYTTPSSQSLTLTSGGTITFNGTYTALASCTVTAISNCSLPATSSGSSAGACSAGYAGACNYSCSNGTWVQNSNSCVLAVTAPTVTTTAPTGVTQTTASSGGTIVSNGGSIVTVSGIAWSTTANPTTANTKTTDGWAIGGPWPDSMTGLTAGTTYHVRAYATNSVGTAYGADVAFTTPVTTYTISTAAGVGGSISPSGSVTITQGNSQSFTVTPNAGYAISAVSVDGVPQGAISSYPFTNVQANHTLTAFFTPSSYIITATAGANGTISPSGAVSVNQGTSQTFTITPNAGYSVSSVTVDGVNKGALTTYTFTNVQAGHTINATFSGASPGCNNNGICESANSETPLTCPRDCKVKYKTF